MTRCLFWRHRVGWLTLLILFGITGCTPSLAPLYYDYEVPAPLLEEQDAALYTRIRDALQAAGWEPVDAEAPNAVATQSRTMSRWGLYTVTLSLEAIPIGEEYVRIYFHPYRRYITGGRSKISYLPKRLRNTVVPTLNACFAEEGFEVMKNPFPR